MKKGKLHIDFVKNCKKLYDSSTFADIEVKVGDATIKAHKFVLSSQSPKFERLLSSNPEEICITIEDDDETAFKTFLRFLYTCEVDRKDLSGELLLIAHNYEHANLKRICADHLIETINEESAINLLILAAEIDQNDLQTAASDFIATNIGRLSSLKNCFKSIYDNENAMDAVLLSLEKSKVTEVKVYDETDIRAFVQSLGILYNSPVLSDVDIQIQEDIVKAHKIVLAQQSPVFSNIFVNKKEEVDCNFINIPKFSATDFKNFLKYLYTCTIEEDQITNELLVIAHEYQNEPLKRICEKHLIKTMGETNATELLHLSLQCNGAELQAKASAFIVDNLEKVKEAGTYDLIHTSQKAVDSILNGFLAKVATDDINRQSLTFVFKHISAMKLGIFIESAFVVDNVELLLRIVKNIENEKEYLGLFIVVPLCRRILHSCTINVTFKLMRIDGSVYKQLSFFKNTDFFYEDGGYPHFLAWEKLIDVNEECLAVEDESITIAVDVKSVKLNEKKSPENLVYAVSCEQKFQQE